MNGIALAESSRLELNYQVGDHFYELNVSAIAQGQLKAQLKMDQEVIASRNISEKKFLSFMAQFVEQAALIPKQNGPCTQPFEIKAPISLTRCRNSTTRSQISHLTRSAEFLLYSQN